MWPGRMNFVVLCFRGGEVQNLKLWTMSYNMSKNCFDEIWLFVEIADPIKSKRSGTFWRNMTPIQYPTQSLISGVVRATVILLLLH